MNIAENINWFDFILMGLATWRLARLLVFDDIFLPMRKLTGIVYDDLNNVISYPDLNPLYCVICTSFWTAIIIAFFWIKLPIIVLIFALSAVASLIHLRIESDG